MKPKLIISKRKKGSGYFDDTDTEYIKHLNDLYEQGKIKKTVDVEEEEFVDKPIIIDNCCDKKLRAIFGRFYWREAETIDEENWTHIST